MGFIDLHSHILYGLDDGAETLAESLDMIEIARRSGTTDMVATPHANSRYVFDPERIEQRIIELGAHTEVRIYPGCDFHLQFDNIEDALACPEKYTVNHKNYLMVELPSIGVLSSADQIFGRLLDAGMVPIITHPERNPHLLRRSDDLDRWVEQGCYVQVTAGSCTGGFGRAARTSAYELIERGLAHFVASDAHGSTARTPNLQDAYATLADKYGEDDIRPLFVDNPAAVLAGEPLECEPRRIKSRTWYRLWS